MFSVGQSACFPLGPLFKILIEAKAEDSAIFVQSLLALYRRQMWISSFISTVPIVF